MEPLKPETVENILDMARPAPAPAIRDDIEEYERLLSERFTRDPDVPMSPQQADEVDRAEQRITQLAQKLFRGLATNLPARRATNP